MNKIVNFILPIMAALTASVSKAGGQEVLLAKANLAMAVAKLGIESSVEVIRANIDALKQTQRALKPEFDIELSTSITMAIALLREMEQSITQSQQAEGEWKQIADEQGWNDASKVVVLEDFIRRRNAYTGLVQYAREVQKDEQAA